MNRFLKLVNMEIHRFRYILFSLMAVTLLSQCGLLIWTVQRVVSAKEQGLTQAEVGYAIPKVLSFPWAIVNAKEWFILPIFLSITVLVLYSIIIWYRDWFGRSTFIYRLLMLPSARWMLYVSKLSAILLFVFCMLAFQLLLLVGENMLFQWIVPVDMRTDSTFVEAVTMNYALEILLPKQFEQFIYSYGLGIIGILVIFTAVLIERSYRRWGILYGIFYTAACVATIVSPMVLLGLDRSSGYWYPNEIYMMELAVCLLVPVISIGLGFWLLRKKITV
ncbi:hypothetical protein [Paenibacillus guangzhouensis]|uniref:hypothetical protein n=1 Tax=Paenibacillus guangzhouensis TaxID=1473112 RepID=UPI001266F4B2|nr:hypothetical protein [Paenibacillus guangzhouensis]